MFVDYTLKTVLKKPTFCSQITETNYQETQKDKSVISCGFIHRGLQTPSGQTTNSLLALYTSSSCSTEITLSFTGLLSSRTLNTSTSDAWTGLNTGGMAFTVTTSSSWPNQSVKAKLKTRANARSQVGRLPASIQAFSKARSTFITGL